MTSKKLFMNLIKAYSGNASEGFYLNEAKISPQASICDFINVVQQIASYGWVKSSKKGVGPVAVDSVS